MLVVAKYDVVKFYVHWSCYRIYQWRHTLSKSGTAELRHHFNENLNLTDYCLEEFEKFRTFLTKKSAEIGQFSGEIGQFSE